MNVLIIWFIQHKITKLYFPEPKGINGRGGSFTRATSSGKNARIFRTRLGASRFLGAWAKGEYHHSSGYHPGHPGNDWEVDHWEQVDIKHIPSRNKEDYEIIMREVML